MPDADAKAFMNIYDAHFRDIYAYAAFRVAPDREAAQDITQEVFLAALRTFDQYRGDGKPLTWLRAIARSKVADYFRASVERQTGGTLDIDRLATGAGHGILERTEKASHISLAMRRISGKHAELLDLKYLEGLSVREIAHVECTSEKAIESALSRARDAFRKAYQDITNSNGKGTPK